MVVISCVECDTVLPPAARTGPPRRYCSVTCRLEASNRRRREDGRLSAARAKQVQRDRAARREAWVPDRTCRQCGASFTVQIKRGPTQRYCGAECRNRAFAARRKSTPRGRAYILDQKRARRAKILGAQVEPVVSTEIFERDEWVCALCGVPIPKDVGPQHPLHASIDHIVPLSKGGAHSPLNVQAAHRICNGWKSDRIVAAA